MNIRLKSLMMSVTRDTATERDDDE